MRASACLLLLLAIACLANAISISNPELVNGMDFEMVESGVISATSGGMTDLRMNTTLPQRSDYQEVDYSGSTVADRDGNMLASIREAAPPNPFHYEIRSTGSVRERITRELPRSYSVPQEYLRYTLPGPKVQSDDPEIRRVAQEVAANSSDDWERVARLAIYVHGLIEYDAGYTGQEKDAKWVLQNRRGVCVEYSTLFVALARSQGIPARFVSGYAFSKYGTWLGHSWAEAYIGKWVPVDPTWLEAGNLDATHIETFKSADNRDEGNVNAFLDHGAQLQWTKDEEFGGQTEAVSVSNIRSNEKIAGYELTAGEAEMGFGDETVVTMKITGSDYRIAELTLAQCRGGDNPVSVVGEAQKTIILRPGEEQFVLWRVKANPLLSSGYIYTCPMLLNSGYFEERTLSLKVTPEKTWRPQFSAWLGRSTLRLGEQQAVYYDVQSPQQGTIELSAVDARRSAAATAGTWNFTYTPSHLGENRVYVHWGGVVQELAFNVSEESEIWIENVSIPSYVIDGYPVPLSVRVKVNGTAAKSLRVTAGIGGQSASEQASFAGERVFNFSILANGTGTQNVSVRLENGGILDDERMLIEIRPRPSVSISNLSFAFVGSETTVVLQLEAAGEPSSMNISINGRKSPAQPGEVSIESPPGDRIINIEWLDAAGNYYSVNQSLRVPARGEPTPTPSAAGTPEGKPACAGFAFLIILAAPLFANRYF